MVEVRLLPPSPLHGSLAVLAAPAAASSLFLLAGLARFSILLALAPGLHAVLWIVLSLLQVSLRANSTWQKGVVWLSWGWQWRKAVWRRGESLPL
eukprot:12010561-Alexandrium_andersonii.AAC.1